MMDAEINWEKTVEAVNRQYGSKITEDNKIELLTFTVSLTPIGVCLAGSTNPYMKEFLKARGGEYAIKNFDHWVGVMYDSILNEGKTAKRASEFYDNMAEGEIQ